MRCEHAFRRSWSRDVVVVATYSDNWRRRRPATSGLLSVGRTDGRTDGRAAVADSFLSVADERVPGPGGRRMRP